MDKKVLYMNDFPKFRYVAGFIVVAYYIFTQLWNYRLSPLSGYYWDLFEPSLYYIFPIISSALFYTAFLVLTFIPLNKSWRYMFLINSILFVFEIIYQFLYVYEDYKFRTELNIEVDIVQSIMSRLGFIVLYFILFMIYLRPFYQRKLSKYFVIITGAILLFSNIVLLLDNIKDSIEFYNSDTYNGWSYYYYYGVLMEGENIDYFLATQVMNSIPVLSIYYLFLSLFISVRKPEKSIKPTEVTNNTASSYEPVNFNPYQQQINQSTYSTAPVAPSSVGNAQSLTEPTVAANPVVYESATTVSQETTVAVNYTPEEVADIIPIAPAYEGNQPIVQPQIQQDVQPQGQALPLFCNQCGYKMPNDFAFCPKCGKKFR